MITRKRAIVLPHWAGKPVERESGGWPVVESFDPPEGDCLVGLTDLSHRPKALLQGPAEAELAALKPGQALWNGQALVGCVKPDKAVIFDLAGPAEPQWTDIRYTDVTDGWILLGIWGPMSLEVIQRLVTVDVERPTITGPLFSATSAHGIRVQLINLRGRSPGFVISCERSQGQNLFDSCIQAGRQFNMKITGVKAFYEWFGNLALHKAA